MSAVIIRRRGLGMSSAKGIAEFSKTGISWVRNDKPLPDADVYIRWGCTSNVPTRNVVNTAKAIHEVNDKAAFRKLCADHELSPPTVVVDSHPSNDSGVQIDDGHMTYPLILRPRRHSQGRNVILINSRRELLVQGRRFGDGWYASELVDKVAEYRVCLVQGRVAWVAKKTPSNPDDIAWNVARGGRFDNVRWGDWPSAVINVAVRSFLLSSLDFGGVDVMVDKDGKATVLEINSAPSLTSPYRQECMAKAFDWIGEHGKKRIAISPSASWKSYIHPALSDSAEV